MVPLGGFMERLNLKRGSGNERRNASFSEIQLTSRDSPEIGLLGANGPWQVQG